MNDQSPKIKNQLKTNFLLWQALSLVLGSLIYILFRTSTLLMFTWFDTIRLSKSLEKVRLSTIKYANDIPSWILFSLPDGLWVFSYTCLILYIWKGQVCINNLLWIILIPFISVNSEIAQLFNIIKGTFDSIDILFYFIGALTPFILFKKSIHYKF